MKRKLNIRSIMFLFVLSLFGLLSFQVPAQSENLELDSLKANFPPGERYFSLGKRDPFVPLVGPDKKGFKKVSSQPSPSKKKRLIKFLGPGDSSSSKYPDMAPQITTLAFKLICQSTVSSSGPPTLSK